MSTLADSLEPPVPQEEIDAAAAEQPKTAEVVAEKQEEIAGEEVKTEELKAKETRAEKFVKIQALDEQKHKRRAAEAEAARLREQNAVLQDRWNQILASQQQPIAAEDQDPLTNHGQRLNKQEQVAQQLLDAENRRQSQAQHAQKFQEFAGHVGQLEREFTKEVSDYTEAVTFLKSRRVKELEAAGYQPQEIEQIVLSNGAEIAARALQAGKNPAEVIYQMAESTGYVKAAKKTDGEQKMQTLQKGAEASKTLATGGVASGKPTPEQIAAMSEDEFADFKRGLKGKTLSDVL